VVCVGERSRALIKSAGGKRFLKDQKKFSAPAHDVSEILAKKDLRLSDLPRFNRST
jgi:hypothetical protein